MDYPHILIIEDGGQLTLNIQRVCREEGYRAAVLDPNKAETYLKTHPVDAIILSGGAASVWEADAPKVPDTVFSIGKPILAICYGHQAMAHRLGGKIERGEGEFTSQGLVQIVGDSPLFANTPTEQYMTLSHQDSVTAVPPGFSTVATGENGSVMAMANEDRRWYGLQSHPEAEHSTHGKTIISNFLRIAECTKDWQPQSLAQSLEDRLVHEVGSDIAVLGFSGGVDSTTVARIGGVLGKRLYAVTLDAGQFREGELEEIRLHARLAGVQHEIVDIKSQFEHAFEHTTDAEVERKEIFQPRYAKALEDYGISRGAKFILQGTLAPDRIESAATGAAKIKTHHNVGIQWRHLLPLDAIEDLFKYEVRDLAREIGLPESVWKRHPFPGPGLFLRVVGAPITFPRVEVVRFATKKADDIVKKHGLYDELSQMPVGVFFGDPVTGIKGDGRAYQPMAVVRPVVTSDFMTLRGRHLPDEVEDEICFEIAKYPQLLGALFDYNPKPPRTTEFK